MLIQKSYINDLFGLSEQDTKAVEKTIGKVVTMSLPFFTRVLDDHGFNTDLENKDLQIIPKLAYYELQPGQTHEGVWHVEGMPDEHIVAAFICYIQNDFNSVNLEYRRCRTRSEEENMMMIPEQNARIIGYDQMNQHLGVVSTREDEAYSWPNALQHRFMKITNNSDRVKKRSFVALFLIDPDVKIVSTLDIPPQNIWMSEEMAQREMETLMQERKGIKMKFNQDMEEEISYCEH